MAYLGSSTIDPDGWVIADGVARTADDGRYANLVNAVIGAGTKNSYTPPNLKGAFLRGEGYATNAGYSGTTLNAFQNHATQTHNHSIEDKAHSHGRGLRVFGSNPHTNITVVPLTTANSYGENNYDSLINIYGAYTGITATNNSTNNVDVNETRPYNYGVAWIIKL